MKKEKIQYGVIDIPQGTLLCNIEKGGDKNQEARYRFSSTGKKTTSRIVSLITNETIMTDLYGAAWAYTDNGWVKTQGLITWYDSYKDASNAYASLTNRKRKIIITIVLIAFVCGIGYLLFRHYKNKTKNINIETTIEPTIQTTEIPINNEIPMD